MKQMTTRLLLLLSGLLLCNLAMAQTITVTSPNGGEVWAGCTSKNITWTASGTSNFYSIDYSTDGGTNWTSVTSFYNTTSGSYSWTVPNINSSTCLVRITDSNNPGTQDQSNATFTITAPLILTAPNGGEKWEAGTVKSITFAATGTSKRYNIQYSTNAGSSWTNIVTNYYNTTGIYNWTVPNAPSTSCLVRITDYYTSCMTDKSDNVFTIDPPTPTIGLTYPNGGQTLYTGKAYNIQWSSTNLSSALIALDYSTDSAKTWIPIVTGISNTGSHSWTVPNTPALNSCMVRLKVVGSTTLKDSSNYFFTIKSPFINLTTPNGSETWSGCNSQTIRWSSGGTVNRRYTLQYSTDNGFNWTNIVTNYYQSSESNATYSWTVPNIQADALIRVMDYNNTTNQDQTDSTFNIVPNSNIIVTTPNGGESWEAGKSKRISWVSSGSNRFRVYYSINNGSTWSYVISNTYNNYYDWTIPTSAVSSNCLIRVQDYYTSCKKDESDSVFTITPPVPVITVTTPNGGQTYYPNASANIYWSSSHLTSPFVTIDFSSDSGTTWTNVASVTNNDGSHGWTIPNSVSTKCLIRVSEYNNPSVFDISNATFTISPPYLNLTSPNGGESWKGCETKTISWTQGGNIGSNRVEYSLDSGATWNYISATSGTSRSWAIPGSASSSKALIRVINSTSGLGDTSASTFTIIPNTDIIVTSPNGGESWEAATSKTLSWVDNGVSRFRIYYSTNGGSSWSYITHTYSNSYNWSVPNNPGSQYSFRVVDYYNTCKEDRSDSVFTVIPPTPWINVTQPHSSSNIYPQQNFSIRWSSQYLNSNFVNIEFSSDSMQTWNTVVNGTNNDGSHTWPVPNNISTKCFIRVSEVGRPAVNDTSNQFSIKAPFLTLTSPNGGNVWKGCENKTISWSVGGGSNSYRLEYSLDSANTWTTIGTYSGSSRNWTIPAKLSSSKTYIRVTDTDASRNLQDKSNAPFTIIPSTDIVLTTPNGGDSLEAGTTKNIAWVDNSVSRFRLYYSTNSGVNYSYITATYSNNYNWSIPNNPGNSYRIRVVDYYNTCKYDESDSNFTVVPPIPKITVTSPGSSTVYPTQTQSIRWSSSYLNSSFVTIDFSSDSGATWSNIVSVTNNDGSHSWTLPNTLSTNCFIRVSEYGRPSVYDWSSKFTIAEPWLTVTTPNGGESWKGCDSYTVRWSGGGLTGSNLVQYSTDSGATWATVGSSTGTTRSWTIPSNLSTSKALIRVTNSTVNKSDVSNSTFTLVPNTDIIVTAPNGNETLEANKSTTISWVDNGVSRARIYYSSNGGASWTYYTSSYSNSISWNVPNVPGSNYKVRVQNYYNSCERDESDSNFTVIPPVPWITISSPNGGTYYPLQNVTLSWNSAYLNSSFVKIEFSSDSMQTWTTVENSTNNDRSHSWTLPNVISNNCYFRISEVGRPSVNDVSNRFTMATPFLRINSPNGGESWKGCDNKTISISNGGGSGSYKVEYTLDSGATWISMGNKSGSFSWQVPTKSNTNDFMVRIHDNDTNRKLSDTSNAVSTLIPYQDIAITKPNGGGSYEANKTLNIQWLDQGVSRARLYYSSNGGTNWSYIGNTYGNSWNWSAVNVPGSDYMIQVRDYYNSCKYDNSDSAFSITPPVPVLTLTSPNGSNQLYEGQSYSIRWSSANLSAPFIRLDYSVDSGDTWIPIVNAANNNGSYSWTVPNQITDKALIRIQEYNNPSREDISDAVFSIRPAIEITAPNGDNGIVDYRGCTVTSIKWTAGGTSRYYRIEYSLDNGATWTLITSSFYSSSSNPVYNWTMPNTASTKALVKVSDRNNLSKTDQSDNTFTITAPIDLIQPNYGGILYVGETFNIVWKSNGTSNYYNIDYSTNGGVSWTSVVFNYNTSGNSYAWKVPGTVSSNCKIRVTDNINTCKKTQSEIPFAISANAKTLSLVSPKGGESWEACSKKDIQWTDSGTSSAYRLEYSANAGQSWNLITASYSSSATTKTFNWTVPTTAGNQYLVRVSDASDTTKTDQSDSLFTVTGQSVPVVSALGSTKLCTGENVTLTSSFTNGNTWYPGGATTQSISVNTAGTYYVVVTDTNGCSAQSNSINVTVGAPPARPTVSAGGSTNFCIGGSVVLTSNQSTGNKWFPGGQTTPSITVTSGGSYSVTYTDSTGCSSTSLATIVTTNPVPTVSVQSPTHVCQGDTVTLTSSSATGNVWFPSGDTTQSLHVTQSGIYYVQVTDGNSCTTNSVPDTVTVKSKPAPPVVTANGSLNLCPGSSVKLTASPSNNITWSTGVTDSVLTVDTSLTVYATYTHANGCSSNSSEITTSLKSAPAKPVISAIGNATFCLGDSVILASSAPGGNNWSTGDTTNSITVKNSGSITVSNTNSFGCTSSSTPVLVQANALPATPSITRTGAAKACFGDTITLTSSSIQNNSWSSGDTTQVIKVTSSATYNLTVVDQNGCRSSSAQESVVINATPSSPVISASNGGSICQGESLTISSSDTSGISWSNGANTGSIQVSNSGNYTATITDTNGCSASSNTIAVSVNALPSTPTITAGSATSFCDGSSVILTSSYAFGNAWSNGGSGSSLVIDSTVTVSVTHTDTNGCKSTSLPTPVTVHAVPAAPSISKIGNSTFCQGDSVTLVSGTAVANYWSNGDTTQNITVKTSGNYSLYTKSSQGCKSDTSTVQVVANPTPAAPVITVNGTASICNGDSVLLSSNYGNGNLWNSGDSSSSIYAKTAGTYSVTHTNSFGCSAQSSVQNISVIATPSDPLITRSDTSSLCQGDSVILYSSAPNGNLWSTGDTVSSITVKNGGTYSVKVDNGTCSSNSVSELVVVHTLPAKPVITNQGALKFCLGDSVILHSGVTGSQQWSDQSTSASIVVKGSGQFTVTAQNAQGCQQTSDPVEVTAWSNPIKPVIGIAGDTVLCAGDSVLFSSSFATGNLWSNGDTTKQLILKQSGVYSVTHTDTNGCSAASESVSVTVNALPPVPTISASGSTSFCDGGQVVLTSSGAAGNKWSTLDTSNSITVTQTGNYDVVVTNAFGCSSQSAQTFVEVFTLPTQPVLSLVGDSIFCAGDSLTILSGLTNGISWSNGDTSSSIKVFQSGNYSVTYTDSNSCTATSKALGVTVNALPPVPSISANGPLKFCDGGQVVLTSSSAGGNEWSTLDTTSGITVKQTGNYDVTVTNGAGCKSRSAQVFVEAFANPNRPVLSFIGDSTFCDGDSVVVQSGYSNNVLWSTGDTTASITVKQSSLVSVTYTDTNNCSATSKTTTVTTNPLPAVPVVSANGPLTFCDSNSVTLTSSAASGNTWSTLDTTASIVVKQSGNYAVTASNQHGCESTSSSVTVNVLSLPTTPVISLSGSSTLCQGDSVILSSSATAGNKWSTGDSSNQITVKNTGLITLFVEDSNACQSGVVSQSVTVNPSPATPLITVNGATTFCQGDSAVLISNAPAGNVWSGGDTTQSIVVTSSGFYSVKVVNSFGCEASSAARGITVNNVPSTPTITLVGSPDFCQGDSVTLISSSPVDNVWSTGDSTATIKVKSSGTVELRLLSGGCYSTGQQQAVNVFPNPAAPVISYTGDSTLCMGDTLVLFSSYGNGNTWSHGGGSADQMDVTQTGSYTVMHTDSNGCSSQSAPQNIVVFALPTPPSINPGGNVDLCPGDTITLTSSAPTRVVWNVNSQQSPTLDVFQAGSYYVTYTDTNSCSILSDSVVVSLLPAPPIPPVTNANNVLETDPASAYQWYMGGNAIPGEIGQVFLPLLNGVFQVEIEDGNGCKSLSEPYTFTTVGVENESREFAEFKLYPNPSPGVFTVEFFNDVPSPISIEVITLSGQVLHRETIHPVDQQVTRIFELDYLSDGIYYLQLKSENGGNYMERITITK